MRLPYLSVGFACLLGSAIGFAQLPKTSVTYKPYAKLSDGTPIDAYEMVNAHGIRAVVINYGATLTELHVPDKNGKTADIVLGFDDLAGYLQEGNPYFGCTIGRVANRVGNAMFTLDGKTYTLAANNGKHSLHGGMKGFDKVAWKPSGVISSLGTRSVSFFHTSKDGDEGYPGELKVLVTYELTDANELKISYEATTSKPTPINLTNHSYFNLAGHDAGNVLGHILYLKADRYTPSDESLLPTGEIKSVKGTPLNFTQPITIGSRIAELKGEPGGYDHNYVLANNKMRDPMLVGWVKEPQSGRMMEILTTEPGMQFYTGNFLDGSIKGKGGTVYKKHQGFCLEAQYFPDSINKPKFPSSVLKPGETYRQTTIYRFPMAK